MIQYKTTHVQLQVFSKPPKHQYITQTGKENIKLHIDLLKN